MSAFLAERADEVRVDRLTVRGTALDPVAARLRTEHVLAGADIRPRGMPPSAVLVVRRIRDPVPRRLSLDHVAIGGRTEWEAAVRSRIADLYRTAARPASGQVASDADAVAFSDEAELLAAFVLDVLDGAAGNRWWWRAVFRSRATSLADVAHRLASTPRLVPPVFSQLDRRGSASGFVLQLNGAVAWRVVEAVGREYRISGVVSSLARPPDNHGPTTHRPTARASPSGGTDSHALTHKGVSDARPRAVPTGDLSWAGYVLLSLGRELARDPSGPRRTSFAAEVARAWILGGAVTRSAIGVRGELQKEPAGRLSHVDALATTGALPERGEPTPPGHGRDIEVVTSASARHNQPPRPAVPGALLDRVAAPHADRQPARESRNSGVRRQETSIAIAPADAPEERATRPEGLRAPSKAAEPDSVGTELAGVAYLINVMLHLDLPEAFETEWRLASRCGAWGTLELLARGLLPDANPGLAADPLWRVLADLAARPVGENLPGRRLMRPRAIRIPPNWTQHGWLGRLPRARAGLETDVRSSPDDPLCEGLSAAARAWLSLVVPYVRHRIKRAGVANDPAEVAAMIARPGRIVVTSSHVDVVMALSDISVAVRRAGLDRDPGWQPGFGRVIRIHFA
jgi:hypothetical protein